MKAVVISILFLSLMSCSLLKPAVQPVLVTKGMNYGGMYKENIQTILILPPINKTNHVDAKDAFHGTLNIPLINRGYYVIPLYLSEDILQREGAANAEVFENQPLNKFNEVFGADAVLFTVIHQWQKNAITNLVEVQVEYIIKSTRTNQVVFQRKGDVEYSTKVDVKTYSIEGMIVKKLASMATTALTSVTDIGRKCNRYSLSDIPAGAYHMNSKIDSAMAAGNKDFRVRLD